MFRREPIRGMLTPYIPSAGVGSALPYEPGL